MRIKGRTIRSLLAAALVITAIMGSASVRAIAETDCPLLSEGPNEVSAGCYAVELPEDVDMLRLRSEWDEWMIGGSPPLLKLSLSDDGDQPGLCTFGNGARTFCAIPGPDAGRMYIHVVRMSQNPPSSILEFQFQEAAQVNGAAVGELDDFGDARMYRFDDLENAALVSLVSGDDVDLSVRRGAPPTLDEAGCVSARHDGIGAGPFGVFVQLRPGTEACSIDQGAGPIYAFVTLSMHTSVFISRHPPYPVPDPCDLLGLGNCSINYGRAFAISGAGP